MFRIIRVSRLSLSTFTLTIESNLSKYIIVQRNFVQQKLIFWLAIIRELVSRVR
jgi:hypothetical protein